jgi:RNA recognition motif-containing protein
MVNVKILQPNEDTNFINNSSYIMYPPSNMNVLTPSINNNKNNNNNNNSMNTSKEQNECTVYLGDLDMETTEHELRDFFEMHKIQVVKIVKQAHSSFAHASFANQNIAKRLLELAVIKMHLQNRSTGQNSSFIVRVMPFNQPSNFDSEANLIIKNLESYLNESDIIAKFRDFGHILSCKLARDEHGNSKCYAYLQFESRQSATEAIDKLNNTYWDERCDPDFKYRLFQEKLILLKKNTLLSKQEFDIQESKLFAELANKIGKKIYVGVFKKKGEYSKIKSSKEGKPSNLYVKNFGPMFGDRDLFNLFKSYGSIKSAKVRRQRIGLVEKPLGCGFVDFEFPEEAEKARSQLDGYRLPNGRVISVTYADCKSRRLRKKLEQENSLNNNNMNLSGDDYYLDSDENSAAANGSEHDEQEMINMAEIAERNSMTSTASVSPAISPLSHAYQYPIAAATTNTKNTNNDFYDALRNRNSSISSEFSNDSSSLSSESKNYFIDYTSLPYMNKWNVLLNTSNWNEYKLFGGSGIFN